MIAFASLLWFFLSSCEYSYRIRVNPADAEISVDGSRITNGAVYRTKSQEIELDVRKTGYIDAMSREINRNVFVPLVVNRNLERRQFPVSIVLVKGSADYSIDDGPVGSLPFNGTLAFGDHTVEIASADAPVQRISFEVVRESRLVFRRQRSLLGLSPIGIFPCGNAPKQVTFSPDDKYIYITLLGDRGFQIFNTETKRIDTFVEPSEWASMYGFVEGLFIEKYRSFFVSQMTTGRIHEYGVNDDGTVTFRRSIRTGGVWSKVIAYSEKLDLLAVSNWCSNNVSLIDYKTGNVVRKLSDIVVPRGLAFSHDALFLYVTSFDGFHIYKYRTEDWTVVGDIYKRAGAMRHAVITNDDRRLFVSNMFHGEVYEIDCDSFTILDTFRVFDNPNTIDLSRDERFLFVSCRGPNNPETYLKPSLVDGMVCVYDVETKTLLARIAGGNQPTGLDVSNNGNYLAFSNFMDDNIELYEISGLSGVVAGMHF
jgi:DNA-binding beta-propeller fold protein YncE